MLLRIFVLFLTIIYSIALQIQLGLPYLLVTCLFFVVFVIDQLVIHLLQCDHGSEHIRMHDAIYNVFACITKGTNFNMIQE